MQPLEDSVEVRDVYADRRVSDVDWGSVTGEGPRGRLVELKHFELKELLLLDQPAGPRRRARKTLEGLDGRTPETGAACREEPEDVAIPTCHQFEVAHAEGNLAERQRRRPETRGLADLETLPPRTGCQPGARMTAYTFENMARVPYLKADEARGDAREALAILERRGQSIHLLQALANSSGALRNFARMGNSLRGYTKLPGRYRELMILHLSVLHTAPYEWEQHEAPARKEGISQAELDALKSGDLKALGDREQKVLAFAQAALAHRLTDDLYAAVRAFLDDEEITDLTISVAWWGAFVPVIIESLKIESDAKA
jgi:alkylhydroperoxidase family enzyme